MSNCVNQVFLSGTCGRDPEIRTTAGGTTVAAFSIATSEGRKDAQGNWLDGTVWSNIKAFGRLAELAREQVKKGTKVFLEGKLTEESWVDKQTGQKRSKMVIVAIYLSVVPSARSAGASQESTVDGQRHMQQTTEITDADIPF